MVVIFGRPNRDIVVPPSMPEHDAASFLVLITAEQEPSNRKSQGGGREDRPDQWRGRERCILRLSFRPARFFVSGLSASAVASSAPSDGEDCRTTPARAQGLVLLELDPAGCERASKVVLVRHAAEVDRGDEPQ